MVKKLGNRKKCYKKEKKVTKKRKEYDQEIKEDRVHLLTDPV